MPANKKGFTFIWKIENFSMLPHQKGERLLSKGFVVEMWKETEWFLVLYPRGENNTGDHVSLYFEKTPYDTKLKVNHCLAIESTESSSEVMYEFANDITERGWGYPKFISLNDIYEKKNIFLPNDILTIRFELSPANENSTDEKDIDGSVSLQYFMTNNCISRTTIPVHRRSLMWPIENITKNREQQEKYIQLTNVLKESPSFKISCNFSSISAKCYIPIEIRQTSFPLKKERLYVKCKISVIGVNEEYQDSAESTYLFSLEPDDIFNFPPFLKASHLMSDKYLYFNDTLLLQCDLAYSSKSHIYHSEFNCMPLAFETKGFRRKTKFIKGIEDLYMRGKFCDVHLQAGGETFPACKMLLCARSSVFTAMFENDMKEKISNVVEITDVDPTALKRMLEFIHVDDVKEELSPEDALKLYKVAEKYNIDCLKQKCSISLTSALSVENVCDVLALADVYNDNFLVHGARTFFYTYSTEVFHSAQWESFMDSHPKLSMKIMHQWIKEQHF